MILNIISCTTLLYWIAAIVLGGVILLLGFRLYLVFTLGICKSKNRMDGKTVIITGCTSGIGKETTKDLAKRGARIIMACRNMDTANQLKGVVTKMITLIILLNGSIHDENKTFISLFCLKVVIVAKISFDYSSRKSYRFM